MMKIKIVFWLYRYNSVWDHALLGFYFCQSRRHQTCSQYEFFLSRILKMSIPQENKNPRLIKTTGELKNLEYTIEEINKIEASETEIIIESTKRKLSAIETEKVIKLII